jgi:cytochrome b561
MKSTVSAYGRAAVWFHWLSALLILVMSPMGFLMVRMPDGAAGQQVLYRMHMFLGLLVLLLTLGRVVWRFFDKTPELPAGLKGAQAWLYRGVHYGLYIFLLVMASSGLAMMALSGAPMPPAPLDVTLFEGLAPQAGHSLFSKVFMALFVAHLVGVLMYQFREGNVLKRIGLNLPIGRTS